MPRAAMLAVLRLEAARAGASVVGEDLGNIPAGLQSALAGSGILGTRLLQFEFARNGAARPAAGYPEAALAAFGTHDLPTAAGWANGHDIGLHHGLGRIDAAARDAALEARRRQAEALAPEAGGSDPAALHRHLARTRSRLALVQIEDALGLEAQANLPGTRDEYPNWRRRLPRPAPALAETPGFAAAAAAMTEEGRTP
jgi:4-alpha-glucanotransferase